ncbi:MAG: hypothetical protein JWO52_2404 [Gammaproteobacteria bacterium]|nr:hypothetical protein [Gammaproteobacteria bacterium]
MQRFGACVERVHHCEAFSIREALAVDGDVGLGRKPTERVAAGETASTRTQLGGGHCAC